MNKAQPYFAVFIIGVAVGLAIANRTYDLTLIDPCESNLPRNQHCVLVALPETTHE